MNFEETKRRLTREIRPGSTRAKSRRSVSEGGKPRDPSTENARAGSSGSSREVRCACQFFMCDSPLPEKTMQALASRPSSRLGQQTVNPRGEALFPGDISLASSRNLSPGGVNFIGDFNFSGQNSAFVPVNSITVTDFRDHEYEPISPPSDREAAAPVAAIPPVEEAPPPVHVTQLTDLPVEDKRAKSQIDTEQQSQPATLSVQAEARLLRIPLDSELIVPSSDTPDPDSTADRVSTPDTQATYLGTPTTTLSSRTDGISTSQVDSATLERLPLKKESRKKKSEMVDEAEQPQGPKIQDKFKAQAGKLKTKIKNIKKPTFTIPNPKFSPKFRRPKFQKPKFQRPKFETPKFTMPSMPSMPSMPKMPDRPNIKFPSFNLPTSMKKQQRPAENQPISTTDTSAESKKNIFDFRTYPRIFERTKKKSAASTPGSEETGTTPEFATVPRAAARKKGPVGARWAHRFTDIQFADDESSKPASNGYNDELSSKDRGDSLERQMEAELRYERALAEDEEMQDYERENQDLSRFSQFNAENMEYSERWRHGSFHQRTDQDLSRPMEYESNRDERSSVASSGHRGVIEEIDSDQFFLREKGISQDNIQVGLYLSSEIRDAFRQPSNALTQMNNKEYDFDASDVSIQRPNRPKRKHLKKTKRVKKTPHASNEEIPFDQESVNTETEEYNKDALDYKTYPPSRPKRNKRPKMLAKEESLDISQASSLPIDDEVNLNIENLKSQEDLPSKISHESLQGNIIGYVEKDEDISEEYNKYIRDEALMYENEIMKNIEQPEIVINTDQKYEVDPKDVDRFLERSGMIGLPKPPSRRHKSLKSLTHSEPDSILGEFNRDKVMQDILDRELNVYRVEHEYIEPTTETPVPPRRTRSRSRASSQPDDDRTSRGAESFVTEEEECQEPPCQKDLRDAMGYAIIDKSQRYRESPLPSTPRRKRKSRKDRSPVETKFFTVPRQLNDTVPPVRPTRNYSTVAPNRPPRRRSEIDLISDEKENIDISQYIEIEDEDHSRDLQSGEIINKMKSRPLPAPPRPPRKTRDSSKDALQDITQQSNIIRDTSDKYEKSLDVSPASPIEAVEEITVSTQTDPLPDDFCCDDFIEEPTDRIVAPTRRKKSISRDSSLPRNLERPKTPLERAASPHAVIIEKRVHTPIEDETVTHASLLVRPVPEYPADSFVSKRFGADIPDILPVISQPDRSEISSEHNLLSESDSTLLPRSEEIYIEEHSTLSTDADTITYIPSTEEDSTYKSIEDQIISEEIPEKPQRRKSQAQVLSSAPQPSSIAPQSPPTIPQSPKTEQQPQIIERIIERQIPVCVTPGPDTEVEVLRASRLQVTELDVEKLNVSELQANKILVSEIDGVSLQISELTSKSGNLVLNGLEIPSGLIQEIIDRLQSSSQQPTEQQKSEQEQSEHQPPSTEQVATQTSIEEPEFTDSTKFTEPPTTEQVATQTSIEIPDEQLKPEPIITEQVATQTSIEIPDEQLKPEPIITEQIATQTSIEIPDPVTTEQVATQTSIEIADEQLKSSPITEQVTKQISGEELDTEDFTQFAELKRLQSLAYESIEDSIVPEDFAELQALSSGIISPTEKARLPSPTIVVDPPEPIPEVSAEEEQDEENAAIKQIKDRIRNIENEMNEFISDFTPDEMTEIQSEIESIIDFASEHVQPKSKSPTPPKTEINSFTNDEIQQIKKQVNEIIDDASEYANNHIESIENEAMFFEPIQLIVPQWTPDTIQTPDDMPGLTTDTLFISGQQIILVDDDDDDDAYPITPEEQAFIDLLKSQITQNEQELLSDDIILPTHVTQSQQEETPDITETLTNVVQQTIPKEQSHVKIDTPSEHLLETETREQSQTETQTTIEPSVSHTEVQTITEQSESQQTEQQLDNDKKKLEPDTKMIVSERVVEPTKPEETDSIIPKEFHELKSEQAEIMETFQKQMNNNNDMEKSSDFVRDQTESSSSPVTPPRPPLPDQTRIDSVQQHDVHNIYSSYYSTEFVPELYSIRTSMPARNISEEETPIHHRRRRHHQQRHLSRSRSSSDEDTRAASHSRRHGPRSPDPPIPQLVGQLTRACTHTLGRTMRQLANTVCQHVGTREGKQDLQLVLVILAIFIVILLLLGVGGGNTVHLHHWEFFNPPGEL